MLIGSGIVLLATTQLCGRELKREVLDWAFS